MNHPPTPPNLVRLARAAVLAALCVPCGGCLFSRIASSYGDGPSCGTVALDVVTAPLQLVVIVNEGAETVFDGIERRRHDQEMRKAEAFLREDPQRLVTDPAAFRGITKGGLDAIAAVLRDPSVPFTVEQLRAVDSIWTENGDDKSAHPWVGRGLWSRPEWSEADLAEIGARLLSEKRFWHYREWDDFVANPKAPEDVLHTFLARVPHGFEWTTADWSAWRTASAARSNLAARTPPAVALGRYGIDGWAPPASDRLLSPADCGRIEAEHRHASGASARCALEAFDSAAAAREALVARATWWNARCRLLCRTPGDLDAGERCYADATGPIPDFVAFVRGNVLAVCESTHGSTSQATRAAEELDARLCAALGLPAGQTAGKGSYQRWRDMFDLACNRRQDLSDGRILRLAERSDAFKSSLKAVLGPDGEGPAARSLRLASELVAGERPGLENAAPAERARFCLDAAACASAAGANAYDWDAFVRPMLAEAFRIDPSLRAEAAALGLSD